MEYDIGYVPVGVMCSGEIIQRIEDTFYYDVSLYDTPIGQINGPVQAELSYAPGVIDNYKPGTLIKAYVMFSFGGTKAEYENIIPNTRITIIGAFDEFSMMPEKPKNQAIDNIDGFKFLHPKNGGGISVGDKGSTTISTGGLTKKIFSPNGYGVDRNSTKESADNMHRVISNNAPYSLSKEHFGMYSGKDVDDAMSRSTPADTYISFRRFVTQTKSPDNWTSVCEGSWAPFVMANNSSFTMKKDKEVLFTRIVNAGTKRYTKEIGELGEGFFTFRLDDIIMSERRDTSHGATSAILGNRFKAQISDAGELAISAVGGGLPNTNMPKFKMTIDKDGNLSVNASGKITFTHGDTDEALNSIVMDPAAGIDVTASKGFRVNGSPLVQSNFVDMIQQNAAAFTLGAMGPSALGPPIVADMAVKTQIDGALGGYYTTGKMGVPALGVISEGDDFATA